MSTFQIVVCGGIVWIAVMASFAVKHLEKIEALLKEVQGEAKALRSYLYDKDQAAKYSG